MLRYGRERFRMGRGLVRRAILPYRFEVESRGPQGRPAAERPRREFPQLSERGPLRRAFLSRAGVQGF